MAKSSLSMESFRQWFEKAIRNDNKDWSQHTVDYAAFKHSLRYFTRRRARLRLLLRESPDGKLSEAQLNQVLEDRSIEPELDAPEDASCRSIPRVLRVAPPQTASDAALAVATDYRLFDESTDGEESVDPAVVDQGGGRRKSARAVTRKVSAAERNEVILFLGDELDKAHMFYLAQWPILSSRLEEEPSSVELGEEILELLAFCTINIVGVRQMLLRYDAYARTLDGTPMLDYYLKTVMKHPTSFRKLLMHEELQAIADSYSQLHETAFGDEFHRQRNMFADIVASSQAAEASAGHEHRFSDSLIQSARNWYLLGGFEASILTMRGQTLLAEMERLAEWRSRKQEIVAAQKPVKRLTGMQVYHLTLNLLSGFLYCMNYYIVEPSSTMYVNRLGAHDALSGTLIGMMPLAAFVSSIPYSMWTNRSFRHPFLMSCTLLIIGNLTYSLADHYSKVWMALAGRFIAGLGAPKCIIRRYMADTTPVSLRTSVNAGFGMVVAAGSAMGPAMAVLLNRIEYTWAAPYLGFIFFNGLTLPGYFMASLWVTFTVIVLLTFEEPCREGLEEQMALEQQGGIPGSPTRASENEELRTIFSGELPDSEYEHMSSLRSPKRLAVWHSEIRRFFSLVTFPVRICLGLLFAKVFTIEALVSATSSLSKNRYRWKVQQVGTLGFLNGLLVIPFSMFIGRLSMSYQDHVLMKFLVSGGCFGLFLLIDISDLVATPTKYYNKGNPLAVSPKRYIAGYFLSYLSIQSFEGVIGSTLSKVIPTALASGTLNSGLLATLIDTFGRACGDLFISAMGFLNIRQLINLLFIPTFVIMLTCLVVIQRYRDLLSV